LAGSIDPVDVAGVTVTPDLRVELVDPVEPVEPLDAVLELEVPVAGVAVPVAVPVLLAGAVPVAVDGAVPAVEVGDAVPVAAGVVPGVPVEVGELPAVPGVDVCPGTAVELEAPDGLVSPPEMPYR
jgi:hypothetical protein